MRSLRVVVVTRRFWPIVGGAEGNLANLAAEWAAGGHHVTVVTARWQPHWPCDLVYRGVRLFRPAEPPRDVWGMIRYARVLGRWLRRRRNEIDVVCVSRLRQEAYAAARALGRRTRLVLRAEGAGHSGDCRWHAETPCGWRIKRRCRAADAVVSPSRSIEHELLTAGFSRDRVHLIPAGVVIPPARHEDGQRAARAALGEVSPSLKLADDAPLAVYTGRLLRHRGLPELVAAWRQVADRRADARLWLVGEGRAQRALEDQIEESGLVGKVVLAGVFDHVDEILAAADLAVQPSHEGGLSMAVLEAMAAGLPVVAHDIPDHRDLIDEGRHGLLVRAPTPDRLAAAILRLIGDAPLARRLGAAARDRAIERFSLERQADDYLRLFERLVDSREY